MYIKMLAVIVSGYENYSFFSYFIAYFTIFVNVYFCKNKKF